MSNADFLSILLIAIGLSADCFAVALSGSVSVRRIHSIQIMRTAFSFGLFQALMPVLGWLVGRTIVNLVADYDHWVAFILLVVIGIRMIWESFRSKRAYDEGLDITKGLLLLTLSVATSIDALAVGLSFAFLEVNIVLASVTIGIVAFIVTVFGFLLGRRVGRLFGRILIAMLNDR